MGHHTFSSVCYYITSVSPNKTAVMPVMASAAQTSTLPGLNRRKKIGNHNNYFTFILSSLSRISSGGGRKNPFWCLLPSNTTSNLDCLQLTTHIWNCLSSLGRCSDRSNLIILVFAFSEKKKASLHQCSYMYQKELCYPSLQASVELQILLCILFLIFQFFILNIRHGIEICGEFEATELIAGNFSEQDWMPEGLN